MLFEIAVSKVDGCSPSLQPAAQNFACGQVVEAYDAAIAVVKNTGFQWSSLNEVDWLLLSAIIHHTGHRNRHRAIHKLAHRHLPDSRMIALMHAWDLSAYGQYFVCKDLLEKLNDLAGETDRDMILAIESYNYSVMGWHDTARKYHERASELAGSNPISWYILSRASAKRTDWNLSVEEGAKATKLAPNWARAKRGLSDSLLAIGDNQSAEVLLRPTTKQIPNCGVQFSMALCSESLGQNDLAITRYQKLLSDWPLKTDLIDASARKLTLLLMQRGDRDAANKVIEKYKLEEFESQLGSSEDRGSKYISMPLVSQTRNHCVPTVAAMVAGSQGVAAKPSEFADGMNTRHGTAMWQMIDFMKSRGFKAVCVKPEVEVAIAMLDQDIPLVGQLCGLFMGHVECVCGYDNHLQLLHLRDPMHWHGGCIKYEGIADRYKGSTSFWALIAPEKIDSVMIKPEWENAEGQAMINLSRACSTAERETAEQAYARIPEDHELKFSATGQGRFVVLTQSQYDEKLKTYVDKLEDDLASENVSLTSVSAMLRFLNEDNADHIEEIVLRNQENLSRGFVDYVKAQCLYAKSQWHQALDAFQQLCHRNPSSDNMWSQLSQIQQQLGLHAESERSLEIALEVAPESNSLQQRRLGNQSNTITFEQKLTEARGMVDEFQSDPESRLTLAGVMADHADGLSYEESLKDCIKYFPRYQWPYSQLAGWYMNQNREDLAKTVLQAGRDLMGDEELPLWDFELAELENTEAPENSELDTNAGGTESADDTPATTEMSTDNSEQSQETTEPTAKHLITESRSHFDQLWNKITPLYAESKQELELANDFQEMIKLDEQNKIHWWESVRFLNLRYTNLMIDQTPRFTRQPAQRAIEFRELLPKSVPGVPEAYVGMFLDTMNLALAPHDCLNVLLEWVDQLTPERAKFPELQFERAFLLESLEKLNDSEIVLKEIIADHPTYRGALYRLGQISEQRGELVAARNYYEQCLSCCPSHYGSLESTVQIAAKTHGNTLKRWQDLLKAFPYNTNYIYRTTQVIAQSDSPVKAHAFLVSKKPLVQANRYHVVESRLYHSTGQSDKAIQVLDRYDADNGGEIDYTAEMVRVDVAVDDNDFSKATSLLLKMHDKWPGDHELIDQLARVLRELDLDRAKAFAKAKLAEGYDVYVLAYIFLQDEMLPSELAIEMLQKVDFDRRDGVALELASALRQLYHPTQCFEYLDFCSKRLPQLQEVRESLAYGLCDVGEFERAIEVAKGLLDEQPDNPRWLDLVGLCYESTDQAMALLHFEKAFELTGKVDALVQIGRTHQRMGDKDEARKILWQTLELDPYNTVSMTNLAWGHGQTCPVMWKLMENALNSRGSANLRAEYFLVSACDVAREVNACVPISWLAAAVQRCQDMVECGGFQNEAVLLPTMVDQWLATWSRDEVAAEKGDIQFRMPEQKWIPKAGADYELQRETGLTREEISELTLCLLGRYDEAPQSLGEAEKFPEKIRADVKLGNAAIAKGDFDTAISRFNHAIDRFDDSMERAPKLSVVKRLIDAENGGSVFDRILKAFPGDKNTMQETYMLVGMAVGAFAFTAVGVARYFGVSAEVSVAAAAFGTLTAVATYFFARSSNASRRLDQIMLKRMEKPQRSSVDVSSVEESLQPLDSLSEEPVLTSAQ